MRNSDVRYISFQTPTQKLRDVVRVETKRLEANLKGHWDSKSIVLTRSKKFIFPAVEDDTHLRWQIDLVELLVGFFSVT